ncbi:DUF4178 domain-containing protein [Herbaspirillum rubrisubalbicans]|uniref:DUF4178 domain-containing protein n=1 Tax=Herbaspirillum rubrisubalbicans TaxID=80842 RepID=UPI00209F7CB0|nr:DUF4178 domain-containing protein [Herbaspirillum rubrisubalbicans]MCP1573392.1 NAD-dependent SIR2 family protein deacetylase [Herbaspirillum rubrisubalbicans]
MQTASCPNCGASTEFKSLASVMAVCGYCRSTVYKDGVALHEIGKISQVLDDYSPIQIGTSGVLDGQPFTVVGRIQLKYEGGLWNEWVMQVGDGQQEWWLSDASGLYTVTRRVPPEPSSHAWPGFDELKPLTRVEIAGVAHSVGDVRTAQCTGGQGELPLALRMGWQARVVDLHAGDSFVTLDFSDGPAPVLYRGKSVTLESLKCEFLRSDDTVRAGSYRYGGKLGSLNCPSCGAAIRYLPGQTEHLVCQSCHSQIALTGAKAEVVAAEREIEQADLTLSLGSSATMGGARFEVIGAMRRTDDDAPWTEYLLHNERRGFVWLVQTEAGWSTAVVTQTWPDCSDPEQVVQGRTRLRRQYDYQARVTYAVGAFNWKVAVGDVTRVIQYGQGAQTLTVEITGEEATWSEGKPVSNDQLNAWLGKEVVPPGGTQSGVSYMLLAHVLAVIFLTLNCIPIFGDDHFWSAIITLALIYVPAHKLDGNDFT